MAPGRNSWGASMDSRMPRRRPARAVLWPVLGMVMLAMLAGAACMALADRVLGGG